MCRYIFPAAGSLRAVVLVALALCATADAGVRTRQLPALRGAAESSLRARAADAERVHALVEIPRGGRAEAERLGVRLLRSAGGDLWLASVPSGVVLSPEPPAGVTALWDLLPTDRTAPGLAAALGSQPAGETALRIKVFRDESPEGVRAAVRALGGRILAEAPRLGIVDAALPAGALAVLTARDDVRWIEPAPPDPVNAANGMRLDAEVNSVQTAGLVGTGVVIGMWDESMAEATHPDLVGRVTAGEAGLSAVHHTTHVAGIALGNGTNSQTEGGGSLQWRGVATAATVVNYSNVGAIAEVDTAITTFGIDLSTNSWVYPVGMFNCGLYGNYSSDAPEFDEIVNGIYGKKLPVVFAAGNERDDIDCNIQAVGGYNCIPPPATAKNVITVGAHQSDAGHMTPFSSWGPTDDGRMKPDVSAPGCQQSGDFGIKSTTLGGVYTTACGTSSAAPVVSGGIAALLQEWRARFAGEPRPATYKALLGCFAKDRAMSGPDYRFGLGAVNLQATVDELQTATTIEDTVDDAQVDVWPFSVPSIAGDTLIVTLAWDDPAAAELASPTLVNDLDLELVSPSAVTFQAFVLDPANPDSLAVPGSNRLDNVEQVRVIAPEAGAWTARVTGFNVPQGPQEYSLVGLDTRSPADAAAATATAVSDTTVQLTWIRPGDVDRSGTLVVRSTLPISWTPSDADTYAVGAQPVSGVFVVSAGDVDHATVALADEPLPPGTTYHYAFFAYDEVPNYSPGVSDSAQTTSDAVSAPLASAPLPVPRFFREGAHPFRERVTLRFEIPRTSVVVLDVFDTAGRRVTTLLEGERKAGSHRVEWDGRSRRGGRLANGVYFVRFRTEGLTATEKVVLVR